MKMSLAAAVSPEQMEDLIVSYPMESKSGDIYAILQKNN